jgi:hypothetical protein
MKDKDCQDFFKNTFHESVSRKFMSFMSSRGAAVVPLSLALRL